jgi:dTDP-4-amino-4,6-dideoxygalactose transaminase
MTAAELRAEILATVTRFHASALPGEFNNTDAVMNRTLWVGVYPGLTAPMMEWIAESFHEFAGRSHRASTVAVL